jgi:hypothetical protein
MPSTNPVYKPPTSTKKSADRGPGLDEVQGWTIPGSPLESRQVRILVHSLLIEFLYHMPRRNLNPQQRRVMLSDQEEERYWTKG